MNTALTIAAFGMTTWGLVLWGISQAANSALILKLIEAL